MQQKLLIATTNRGKLQEIGALLVGSSSSSSVQLLSLDDMAEAVTAPFENGNSFEENAFIKAKYYAEFYGLPVISDDSGLEIEKLGGRPSIQTADWAEVPYDKTDKEQNSNAELVVKRDYEVAFSRIRAELTKVGVGFNEVANRYDTEVKAKFCCVICLYIPDSKEEIFFRGEANGYLKPFSRGKKGFGYDPIFYPQRCGNINFNGVENAEKSFAELSPEQKNSLSHRGKSLKMLCEYLL